MKKYVYKTLVVLLLLSFIITTVPQFGETAYAATPSDASKLVSAAKSYIGKSGKELGFTVPWCTFFVQKCGEKAGLVKTGLFPTYGAKGYGSTIGYAVSMADWFTQNNKGKYYYFRFYNKIKDNRCIAANQSTFKPQAGDLIVFKWTKYDDGRIDHIGIVTGADSKNVYYIDGNSGSGTQSTRKVKSDYYPLKSTQIAGYVRPNYPSTAKPITMTVTGLSVSNSYRQDVGPTFKGIFKSTGATLSSITGIIKDSSGKIITKATVKPNAYSYNLQNSALYKNLSFKTKAVGKYTLTLTVVAGTKSSTSSPFTFTVLSPVKISFSNIIGPGTFKEGQKVYIKGKISSSQEPLVKTGAILKDSKGKILVNKANINLNTYSYNLYNSNLYKSLPLTTLKKGDYTLQFYGVTASKTIYSSAIKFKVNPK